MERWNTGNKHQIKVTRSTKSWQMAAVTIRFQAQIEVHSLRTWSRNTEGSWRITGPTIPKPLPRSMTYYDTSFWGDQRSHHRRTPKDYLHFVSSRRSEHLQWDSSAARRIDDQNPFSEIQLLLSLASPPPPEFHHPSPQAGPSACRTPTTWHRQKRLALKHIIIREAAQ